MLDSYDQAHMLSIHSGIENRVPQMPGTFTSIKICVKFDLPDAMLKSS